MSCKLGFGEDFGCYAIKQALNSGGIMNSNILTQRIGGHIALEAWEDTTDPGSTTRQQVNDVSLQILEKDKALDDHPQTTKAKALRGESELLVLKAASTASGHKRCSILVNDKPTPLPTGALVELTSLEADSNASAANNFTMKAPKEKSVPIISCDGGGARLVFSMHLMTALEKDLASELARPNLKLGEVFKVFGGTSAGAIAALALNIKDPRNDQIPLYSAKDLNDQMQTVAQQIFSRSVLRYAAVLFNYPKYNRSGIQRIAESYFKDGLVKDSLNEVLVPTYELCSKMRGLYITRKLTRENEFFKDLKFKKLLACATAAPTYFKPASYKRRGFIDGGIFANNPAEATLIHARHTYQDISKFVLCSFGTGITPTPLDLGTYNPNGHRWGYLTWLPNLLSILMNGSSQTVHENVKRMYGDQPGYYRWQDEIPSISLDDTDSATFDLLTIEAQQMLETRDEEFRRMIIDVAKAVDSIAD